MGLYEHLAPVYDELFPANPATISFLARLFSLDTAGGGTKPKPRLLDLGAATGEHAAALASLGADVSALEPSPELASLARRRARESGLPVTVIEEDMRKIAGLFSPGSIDFELCLGNTLPHLADRRELAAFFTASKTILNSQGRLVLQLVNYDLIGPGYSFPVIKSSTAIFRRNYAPIGNGSISFNTELELDDGRLFKDSTRLFPIRPGELCLALEEAGLPETERYLGWDGSRFDESASPFLIIVAGTGAAKRSP